MGLLRRVTQRLFGRTSIDSLDLNQGAWYIDEVAVTATAAQLNAGTSSYAAKSVTASTLAAGVAGKNMSGGDGSAFRFDPAGLHFAVAAGTAAGVNVPVTGMSVGDYIVSVVSLTVSTSLVDRTSEYAAGAAAMVKAAGTDETGHFLMYYWIDRT